MFDKTEVKEINRAVLVGLNAPSLSREENADDESLDELAALLDTAGGQCLATVLQNKDAPAPRTVSGAALITLPSLIRAGTAPSPACTLSPAGAASSPWARISISALAYGFPSSIAIPPIWWAGCPPSACPSGPPVTG